MSLYGMNLSMKPAVDPAKMSGQPGKTVSKEAFCKAFLGAFKAETKKVRCQSFNVDRQLAAAIWQFEKDFSKFFPRPQLSLADVQNYITYLQESDHPAWAKDIGKRYVSIVFNHLLNEKPNEQQVWVDYEGWGIFGPNGTEGFFGDGDQNPPAPEMMAIVVHVAQPELRTDSLVPSNGNSISWSQHLPQAIGDSNLLMEHHINSIALIGQLFRFFPLLLIVVKAVERYNRAGNENTWAIVRYRSQTASTAGNDPQKLDAGATREGDLL
ncbi:MAG: hypothetical protein LBT98_02110 [Puniceicoccales bacterium]|jgi:hypothetical protein|nr:hypothetical protein [Puniceicoccales bacterium]